MDITVSVRHFELDNEVRDYAVKLAEAAFSEFRLRISSVNIVLDLQRNLITAHLDAAVKEHPVTAASQAYDNVYKAIDDVIAKASAQMRRYLDKKQDHKHTPPIGEATAEPES